MNALLDLIRPEIRKLRPYRSARFEEGLVRLNANETPWRPPGDESAGGLNHYPDPRPVQLEAALARHYRVPADRLLVTRGSSEAIDLLIRCFCRAGQDRVVICPPTFGMYEVYAQVQGAGITTVPLLKDQGFGIDLAGIEAAWTDTTKLVFVCSPNNPTGNPIARQELEALAELTAGRGLLVIDGAYAEFADDDPTTALLDRFDNVVVLRTLSKAAGLAGVRCGVALGNPAVIGMLGCILPPFSFPSPCEDAVLGFLAADGEALAAEHVTVIRSERERLAAALSARADIRRVWPSEANFLLVEAEDPAAFVEAARGGGILLRDFSWDTWLDNAIRITIGNPEQNDQLLSALGGAAE